MSTHQQLDALAAERTHNRTLLGALFAVAAIGAIGVYFAWTTPKAIELHIAPDMRAGQTIRVVDGVSPVPPTNVYSFAYYIWQQINRWQADGVKDYGQQIFRYQSYVTPRCRAQLQADMDKRFKSGELRGRTRQVAEIPGLGYAVNRVIPEGRSAWTVLLDMQLMETFRGQAVKDAFIRYPIRVVRYDVDPARNPWGLAIDCYGSRRPARLASADVQAAASGEGMLDLPTGISPVALPTPEAASGADGAVEKGSLPGVPDDETPAAAPAAPSSAAPAPSAPSASNKS